MSPIRHFDDLLDNLEDQIGLLKAENARLVVEVDAMRQKAISNAQERNAAVATLEFYADAENWTEPNQANSQELFDTPMGDDLGERARAALSPPTD